MLHQYYIILAHITSFGPNYVILRISLVLKLTFKVMTYDLAIVTTCKYLSNWYWNLLLFLDLDQTDISLKQWRLSTLTLFLFKTVWMLILLEEWDATGPVWTSSCHFSPHHLPDTIQHLTTTTQLIGVYPRLCWVPQAHQKKRRSIIAQ